MSRFLDDLRLIQTGWHKGRAVWKTLAPLAYHSDLLGETIVVPDEFITDLASVPRLPIAWLVAGGRGSRSAVLHDFAYQFGKWTAANGEPSTATRRLADAVFRESLAADPISGAGPAAQRLMWLAVRLLAGFAWEGDRTRALNPIWSTEGLPTPHRRGGDQE